MTIDETKVVGYKEIDGQYVVFVDTCPRIIGRGNTPQEALNDLIEVYRAIIKAIGKITCA